MSKYGIIEHSESPPGHRLGPYFPASQMLDVPDTNPCCFNNWGFGAACYCRTAQPTLEGFFAVHSCTSEFFVGALPTFKKIKSKCKRQRCRL